MVDNENDLRTRAMPRRIGKYEVRGVIGQGGMGVVYRGYDTDIDRLVAVKVLYPHLNDEGFGPRFRQEARAAARCVHRNIVTVFDFGTTDNAPYMVMEYVDGIDLRSFLKADRSLAIQESFEIVLQVLAALAFAHEHGVVHRDIKPGNILLLDDGLVKVTDFGVAKLDTSDLTRVGDMIGTPSYMSPEAHSGAIVDGRSDLYAVGVVLLELLCGKRPKPGQSPCAEINELLRTSSLDQVECRHFQTLLDKALAEQPGERFQSAQEFSNALKQLLAPNAVYQPDTENLAATIIETKQQVRQASQQKRPSDSPTEAEDAEFSPTMEMTARLSDALSPYLGPVSSYVIRSASKNCRTLDALIKELADKIPNPQERSEFVESVRKKRLAVLTSKATGTGTPASPVSSRAEDGGERSQAAPSGQGTRGETEFPPDLLAQIAQQMTAYIGPLAPRLVQRTAKRATDLRQLYKLLAEHIEDAEERRRFLSHLR